MSNINPIGIDQTTGQNKPIGSNDSVVNNIGQQIGITSVIPGDYSGTNTRPALINSWGSPTKLNDPQTLPANTSLGAAFSPGGEYLAVGCGASPRLLIYQKVNQSFYALPDPASLPPSGSIYGLNWSLDGQFLAVPISIASAPNLYIYQRNGSIFTLLPFPASLPPEASPNNWSAGTAFSPNGEFLALTTQGSPYVYMYQRNGTTFTKIPDSSFSSLPTSQGGVPTWSPDGQFLAIPQGPAFAGSPPYINIYQRTGLTNFTRLPDPASLPNARSLAASWSPSGEFLAVSTLSPIQGSGPAVMIYQRQGTSFNLLANQPSTIPSSMYCTSIAFSPDNIHLAAKFNSSPTSPPNMLIWQRNGTVFTGIPNPSTLPTGGGDGGCCWSPNNQLVAFGHGASPYLSIYATGNSLPSSGVGVNFGA